MQYVHTYIHHSVVTFEFSISDLNWQSCAASHDGLTEAIQLLSCRPSKVQTSPIQGYTAQHGDIQNID